MSQESLKAQFFLTRPNGSMVPLVAMDELPTTFTIRNVPRLLSPHDVSGMTGVGTFEARHLKHVVDLPVINNQNLFLDHSLMGSKFAGIEHHLNRPGIPAATYQGPPNAFGIQEQAPSTPTVNPATLSYQANKATAPASTCIDRNAGPLAQQTLPPWHDPSALPKPLQYAPGVKEYCSFWLRSGECDYAQQGCLYKHEMPLDLETLNRIGLTDIPRWYRQKHRLGSYHAVSTTSAGTGAKKSNMTTDWRKDSGPKSRQDDSEATRASFERMTMTNGTKKRGTSQYTSIPVYPPATPGPLFRQMSSTNTRSHFPSPAIIGTTNTPARIINTGANNISLPYYTIQQRQNRQTLEKSQSLEAEQQRKMVEAFGPGFKIEALGIQASNSAASTSERPATSSSTSSRSAIASPVESGGSGTCANSATATDSSDSEALDLLSDDNPIVTAEKTMTALTPQSASPPASPKLRPVRAGEVVKIPKSTYSAGAAGGKKAAKASRGKKGRGRKVKTSGSEEG